MLEQQALVPTETKSHKMKVYVEDVRGRSHAGAVSLGI